MKKILLLMPELFNGGAETQFKYLIQNFDRTRYQFVVVVEHSYFGNSSKEDLDFIKSVSDVEFFELENISAFPRSRFDLAKNCMRLYHHVCHVIEKTNPDILLMYSVLSLRLIVPFKFKKVKVIYSERNGGDFVEKYYLKHFIPLKTANAIICNSEVAQSNYLKHKIATMVIHNGINVDDVAVSTDYISDESIYKILIPARIDHIKNQLVVIEALHNMNPRILSRLKVIFIGKVQDVNYYNLLKSKVVKYKLDQVVNIMEFTPNISELYGATSLVLLPSLSEGLSNVILESFLRKCICLTSDIPMNRVVNTDERFWFKNNDFEDLAKKIEEVMCMGKNKINTSISKNYHYVLENFSIQRMVHSYEMLFDEL